ncbi:MAG: hypothetical protein NTW86_16630 [Candidatus Sumerlaeota bacterium]|nr:hypothetical protein [Candidatus Sumerlaeota bacterium]
MKIKSWGICLALVLAFSVVGGVGFAEESKAPIDVQRARQLMDKEGAGEKLSSEDQVYLDRAKRSHLQLQVAAKAGAASRANLKPNAAGTSVGFIPLSDMTTETYKGEDGGLYGKGKNEPPKEQMDAAMKAAKEIQPLDADGKPSPDGKIVLLGLGMSNTTMEFSVFKEVADADPDKAPAVVLVDVAQFAQDSEVWAKGTVHGGQPHNRKVWDIAEGRIEEAGVTTKQIQAMWLKQARMQPARIGVFPKHAQELQKDIETIIQLTKQRYPNLRIAYLSNRIYGGYASTDLNPEPYAYETGFGDRWVIQDQIKGDPGLNFDPAKGEVKAPVLLWGPDLWADGLTPRKSDGLIWKADEYQPDGTHPKDVARKKVADMLLKFFKTDPTAKAWFVRAK